MDPEIQTADSGTETTTTETHESSFDMDRATASIAAELFPGRTEPEKPEPKTESLLPDGATLTEPATPAITPLHAVPKSWPKEMHEHWSKVDPAVQAYWETRESQMLAGLDQYKGDATFAKSFKEALTPYRQTLQQLGVDELTAAKQLFEADNILRYSTPEQKLDYFKTLAKAYSIPWDQAPANPQTPPVDPQIASFQQELQSVKHDLAARQRADDQAAMARVNQEIEAFAADTKAHPHFYEVHKEVTAILKSGYTTNLQEAYDYAVRMNPSTYAKETATAQQAALAKYTENARLDALKAKTAASTNVRQRETKRTPTEPIGTMEDTIKETLRNRRASVAT